MSAAGTWDRVAPRAPWNQGSAGLIIAATMPFISGKQAFLSILRQEGVAVMFGNPGTTELPLNDALVDDRGFQYILGAAGSAGHGDGRRLRAWPAAALGVVNLHISLRPGQRDGHALQRLRRGSPLLVTAGQQDRVHA